MKTDKHIMRRLLSMLVAVVLMIGVMPGNLTKVHAEEEDNGKAIYDQIEAMGDREPADWKSNKDPFGYGLNHPFYLNQQQELLMLRSNGVSGGNHMTSFDTLKSGDTTYPFDDAKHTWSKNLGSKYTLSFIRSVAFDPTGSGRKDHVAYIGVYASKKNDPNNNPPYVQMWVMDKNGRTSDRIDIAKATWMCNDSTFNYANMWDFNAMNFLGITAGDYDNDGKESVVVWACASTPTLKEVTVTPKSNAIDLYIRYGDGYPDSDGSLFLKPYTDTSDRYVYNRIHAAIDTGDINGDGIDDLVVLSYVNRVDDDYRNKVTEYYLPSLAVSYGVSGTDKSVVRGEDAVRRKYVCWSDGYEWRIAPAAAGLAVGDVNGDGRDEAVVAGFYHKVKGILGEKVKTPYDTLDKKTLVVGVYGKGLSQIVMQTDLSTNMWTRGGDVYGGLFLREGTEGDSSWQQTAVETVAINGKGRAEHIFINGSLYTLNGSKVSQVYTPEYFTKTDEGMDGMFTEETYIRSMAVGNFDGNEEGYEQIAYVIGGADSNAVGNAKYTQGMMGGIYEKDGAVSQTAVDYFNTSMYSIQNNYYPDSSSDCEVDDVLSYELTAWDTDSDGLRVQYVGKAFNYTDPTVMAVLQAPPYFDELKGAMTGYETAYTISTSYSYATGHGDSTSFSIGAELEVEAEVVKLNAGLSYATSWEKTFTDELTTSDEYSFTAIGEDQVVLYRTPVTTYFYQVEVNGNFSDANTTSLSFPGVPAKALMSLEDYNAFVRYYNSENKRRAQEAGLSGDVPQMKQINSDYLGNEGNPFGYMSDTDDHSDVTILQATPNSFEMGSSSTGYSWSQEHSSSEEETMEHGFSFEFSLMFQLRAPVGHTGVGLAVKTSLEYMHSTSVSETNAKGKGISCEVGNMDPDSLSEMNVSRETANQYGFSYQMVTWPSGIKSIENLEDWEHDDDEPSTKIVDVPIYGYLLSGVKAGAPAVTDLYGEFDKDENNAIIIRLNWSNPATEDRPVGAYTIYLDERDGSLKEVATLPADTTEYVFSDLDGRDSYSFMVRAKKNMSDTAGSVDSNRAYLYLGAPAIYSIELLSSTQDYDTYRVIHTDGTETEIVVRHGVGIVDIKKTSSSDDGLIDTYTVYLSDGNTLTFEVRNGREIELRTYTDPQTGAQIIQYRYKGDDNWKDLVEVSEVAFVEGRKVELQIADGYIQWRYEGDEKWTNLLALADLKGEQGETGTGIESVECTSSTGNVDTYTITYTDGSTSTFTVTNGLSAYELAVKNGLFTGTEAEWIAQLVGNGIGIKEIKLKSTSEDGMIDTYVVIFTDGSSYPFEVRHGDKGDTGNGIVSITRASTSEDGLTDTYRIEYSNGTFSEFTVTNGKNGADGLSAYDVAVQNGFEGTVAQWLESLNGNGIVEIKKNESSQDGLVDTYTIYYKDGTSTTFTVTNGRDGVSVVNTAIDADGNLIITMSDNTVINAGRVNGNDGVSIKSTKVNSKGELIITLSTGESFNLGKIVGNNGKNGTDGRDGRDGADGRDGKDGKDGRGISSMEIDADGNLIVTLSDGSKLNVGKLQGYSTNNVPWWMLAWNTALTAGVGGLGYGMATRKKARRKEDE